MNFNITKSSIIALVIATGLFTGCTPDEVSGGNPLTESDLNAAFTATQAGTDEEGNVIYNFEGATDANIQYHTWKFTNVTTGQTSNNPIEARTVENTLTKTFTTSGTYKIQHRVAGRVGGTNFVSEQTIDIVIVAPPQEFGPNLIQSPNFETASDWTVFNTDGSGTVTASWAFNGNSATVSGGVEGVWAGQGIYQAVQVEAGTYYIDMNVSSPGASSNMWFQVFTGDAEPQQNADYLGDDFVKMGLNTWAGCAVSAFDGQLSEVGCVGTGTDVTFAAPQTVYFVIKCGTGSANGVNNITVKDVVMKKYE
jgi:hypothetical protein